MKATVSKDNIKKVAELTKLNLSSEEISKYSEIFTDIVEYIDVLNELNLEDTKETYQVNGLTNVFQDDNTTTTLSVDNALDNASHTKKNMFATSAVFDR